MEKLKQLLTSKKFWTLIAALVAAFAAFFTTSCATSTTLTVRGAQVDSLDFNRTVQFKMKNNYERVCCQSEWPSRLRLFS